MPADERPSGGSTTRQRGTGTSRRSLLLAGVGAPAALVLAGCSLRLGQPDERSDEGPSVDEQARARAAADADVLAVAARAAAQLRPDLAPTLQVIARQHAEHALALRPASRGDSATGSATGPTTGPATGPTRTARPLTRSTALSEQRAAEQAAVSAVEADLVRVSGDVARLLASVAACRAVHVAQLDQVAAVGS